MKTKSIKRHLPLWRHAAVAFALFFAFFQNAAALAGEKDVWAKAMATFEKEFYPQAERQFMEFAATYTNSALIPDAILFQAACRISQSNYEGALELLRGRMPSPENPLADRYALATGQALLRQGKFQEAADVWGNEAKDFPNSPHRLLAAYSQALAVSKMENWPRVIELLRKEDGDFQIAAKSKSSSNEAISGFLLLAEALLKQHQYAEGEKVIANLPPGGPFTWRRQFLLARFQLADGRAREALAVALNLPGLPADKPEQLPAQRAESFSVLGETYEALGQFPNAIGAYTNNLTVSKPGLQRQALSKTIQLMLKQNQTNETISFLSGFVSTRPREDASMDIACVALGELKLKAYHAAQEVNAPAETLTNLLQEAITNLDRVILNYTNSPFQGKACLARGWCSWAQGDISGAKTNFGRAVGLLDSPEDQTVARFKLADTQFKQRAFGEAVTNYSIVLDSCEKSPTLKTNFYDKVLYQLFRASIECDDAGAIAGTAAKNIVNSDPETLNTLNDRCLLLKGEYMTRKNDWVEARKIFTKLLEKYPNTPELPEVKYAIARTYVQEGDWSAAAACFDSWVTNFTQHSLLPRAEFSRALAYDKAGFETNAFGMFTNFVVQFSTNSLAPLAQNWVADYYFNRDDYVSADKNYQQLVQLSQKFPEAGELAYQARLMVGRSRCARQELEDASGYLAELITDLSEDSNAPPRLMAQTYFALGDTSLRLFLGPNSTNKWGDEAVTAFSKITNGGPANTLAPLAMIGLGECHFAWARKNTNSAEGFSNALRAYESVLQMSQAGAAARNEAQVKCGLIFEKLDKPEEALLRYLDVVFEPDPSHRDPVWVKEAGVKAAELCIARQQWGQALKIYDSVLEVVPSLRRALEPRIAKAKAHLDEAGRKQPGGNLK